MAGRRVLLLEQEPQLGGQAYWSFGGLFLVNSKEQRWLLLRDSWELAQEDWMASSAFDREPELPLGEDHFGQLWAEAYLQFAASEMRGWLRWLGVRFFPLPAWAERGGALPGGHGNRVPRVHITWGTGPGLLDPWPPSLPARVAFPRTSALARLPGEVNAIRAGGGKPPQMRAASA